MNPRVEKVLRLPAYQRVLILLGVVVLVAASFVYLIYLPKQEEYRGLQGQNANLQARLVEEQRIAANLPTFRAEYQKMEQQLKTALTELPNKREIPALLTTIANLAKDNGLDILRFKPAKEVPKGFYAEVPVELSLAGTYHEAALFFYAVGNLPRIVDITNLNMGKAKTVGGRTELSVSCLATTFRFLDKAEANKAKRKKR